MWSEIQEDMEGESSEENNEESNEEMENNQNEEERECKPSSGSPTIDQKAKYSIETEEETSRSLPNSVKKASLYRQFLEVSGAEYKRKRTPSKRRLQE